MVAISSSPMFMPPTPMTRQAETTVVEPALSHDAQASVSSLGSADSAAPIVLADRVGLSHVSLTLNALGGVNLNLDKPQITTLVFAGGGAKGLAYTGVMAALVKLGMDELVALDLVGQLQKLEQGGAPVETRFLHLLNGIKKVIGTSAGGIFASLLASGIGYEAFDKLVDTTDFNKLLDTNGAYIGKDGEPLKALLRTVMREALLGHLDRWLADSASENSPAFAKLQSIQAQLKQGGVVTFGMLDQVSQVICQIKQLEITATRMEDGRPQLRVFNADLDPDMDVALAVWMTMSLPVVFESPTLDSTPFKAAGDPAVKYQDGGVLANKPSADIIDQRPKSVIPNADQLIIDLEARGPTPLTSSLAMRFIDWLVGAPNAAAEGFTSDQLNSKELAGQVVVLPLKTEKGDFSGLFKGTLAFDMPLEIRNYLQGLAETAVTDHLKQRYSTQLSVRFNSLESCLLSLDLAQLHELADAKVDQAAEVLRQRQMVERRLAVMSARIRELGSASKSMTDHGFCQELYELDLWAEDHPDRQAYLAEQLNQNTNAALQGWLNDMSDKFVVTYSVVAQEAVAEYERRDVATIARNIQKELIYPSRYSWNQTPSNIDLLNEVNNALAQAQSRGELARALQRLSDHYQARNALLSRPPVQSWTKSEAKRWQENVKGLVGKEG